MEWLFNIIGLGGWGLGVNFAFSRKVGVNLLQAKPNEWLTFFYQTTLDLLFNECHKNGNFNDKLFKLGTCFDRLNVCNWEG